MIQAYPFSIMSNHCFDCSVTFFFPMAPAVGPSLFSQGGHGIFNVRSDLIACCAHEGETRSDESARALTRKN